MYIILVKLYVRGYLLVINIFFRFKEIFVVMIYFKWREMKNKPSI